MNRPATSATAGLACGLRAPAPTCRTAGRSSNDDTIASASFEDLLEHAPELTLGDELAAARVYGVPKGLLDLLRRSAPVRRARPATRHR